MRGMKRKVSSEDINDTIKKYNTLINYVCLKYVKYIPADDLHTCKLFGTWTALGKWDEDLDGGARFSTYLYMNIDFQCKRFLQKRGKYFERNRPFREYAFPQEITDVAEIKDMLESIPKALSCVLIQYYIKNMTLKEIGEANGYSHETARNKILEGIDLIRNKT